MQGRDPVFGERAVDREVDNGLRHLRGRRVCTRHGEWRVTYSEATWDFGDTRLMPLKPSVPVRRNGPTVVISYSPFLLVVKRSVAAGVWYAHRLGRFDVPQLVSLGRLLGCVF
jgi:hypothetical protein